MGLGVDSTAGVNYAAGNPYYDNILTNWFLDRLPNARNDATVLLGMMNKRPHIATAGRFIVFPAEYGRNTGVGNVGYGAVIPRPGRQSSATVSTLTRTGMARIALDGDVIRHGKTNGGAYFTAESREMERVLVDVSIDRARQVHNDGSGRLAQVTSTAAGGVVTLQVNSSIEGAATTRAAGTLENYFEVGMRIGFADAATTATFRTPYTSQQYAYVAAVTVSGATVTITCTTTEALAHAGTGTTFDTAPTALDWIFRVNTETTTGLEAKNTAMKNEIMGIGGIFSDIGVLDGTTASGSQQSGSFSYTNVATTWFQGVVVSTNSWNKGIVLDNGGTGNRAVSEALMQSAISDIERINNAQVQCGMVHPATYDSIVQLGIPDKRYVNTGTLALGHDTVTFNGIPYIKDRHAYQNRIVWIDPSQIEILETAAVGPIQINDSTVWQLVSDATGDYDKGWRGWKWDDQLCVTGVRNRCGGVLTELNF